MMLAERRMSMKEPNAGIVGMPYGLHELLPGGRIHERVDHFLSERWVALHLARERVDQFVREAGHMLGVHPLQGVALAQADQGLVGAAKFLHSNTSKFKKNQQGQI